MKKIVINSTSGPTTSSFTNTHLYRILQTFWSLVYPGSGFVCYVYRIAVTGCLPHCAVLHVSHTIYCMLCSGVIHISSYCDWLFATLCVCYVYHCAYTMTVCLTHCVFNRIICNIYYILWCLHSFVDIACIWCSLMSCHSVYVLYMYNCGDWLFATPWCVACITLYRAPTARPDPCFRIICIDKNVFDFICQTNLIAKK